MPFSHSFCPGSNQDGGITTAPEREADISSLMEMLGSVDDPRGKQGKRHSLSFVLAVCVVATLAGARGYSEIARKAKDMPPSLLRKLGAGWDWFSCSYRFPSKRTVRTVLSRVDASQMDRITGRWIAGQAAETAGREWEMAIDGKVLRGAWTSENDQVTLFSAMIREKGITIAQVRVPDGTNETTQADALLNALPVPENDSVIITIDAAHTQVETAKAIRKRPGWHYIMNVKGNQESLMKAIFGKVAPLTTEKPHHVMEDRSRGRLKKWSAWITSADGIDFPDAAQAAIIIREIFEPSGGKVSKEFALIVTSGKKGEMTAADVNYHQRSHWGIENKEHYPRDTVYREDHNQTWKEEGPNTLATLRNLAMSLIRLKGVNKIKETTEWIAADRTRALIFMIT